MALDVISFEKSLDERLDEYLAILYDKAKPLPASEIRKVWCNQVEIMVEPARWQALWKVSRLMCKDLGIQFPTVIFVVVDEVFCSSLSALVSILAVQDDIDLPEQYEVPLIQLFPTVQQENSSLSVYETAECLDQLRYFYSRIWLPWDDDDDDAGNKKDWVKSHLEPRLNMYKDMKSGLTSWHTAEHFISLLQKSRELKQRIEALEAEGSTDNQLANSDCMLLDLNSELEKVKNEVEILENPFMRKLCLQKKLQQTSNKRSSSNLKEVFVVWLGGCCDELIKILFEARNFIQADAHVKPSTLQEAMEEAIAGDVILLCPGVHRIEKSITLVEGGTIKGVPRAHSSTLACMEQSNFLLDWCGMSLLLQDVTLWGDSVRAVVIVRRGVLILRGCSIEGHTGGKTVGIMVLKDGRVELDNCQLSGLREAIQVDPGAAVSMTNCKISSCKVGIQAYEESFLSVKDSTITACNKYGFVIQTITAAEDALSQVGSLDLLASFDTFSISNATVKDNAKGDVLMAPEQTYASCKFHEKGQHVSFKSDDSVSIFDSDHESSSSRSTILETSTGTIILS